MLFSQKTGLVTGFALMLLTGSTVGYTDCRRPGGSADAVDPCGLTHRLELTGQTGEEIMVWKRNVQTGECILEASSHSAELDIEDHGDSWTFTLHDAGTAKVKISAVGTASSAGITVRVREAQSPGKPLKVLFLGDSLTQAPDHGGFVKAIKDELGPHVVLMGSQVTVIDGSAYENEGRSGWTWWHFASAGSPLWNNGSLDIANYETVIGGVPDVVVTHLGTNDLNVGLNHPQPGDLEYNAELLTGVEATIDLSHGYANEIYAAFREQWPSVVILHGLVVPPADRSSGWITTQQEYRVWRSRMVQRGIDEFRHRENEGIRVIGASAVMIDPAFPDGGFQDSFHPNPLGAGTLAQGIVWSLL